MDDFHMTRMGHKFYSNDVPRLIRALETIGDELAKLNTASKAKEEHYKEILNNAVYHISVGENLQTTIGQLLLLGFEPNELINDFSFQKSDVEYCLETLAEEEDLK